MSTLFPRPDIAPPALAMRELNVAFEDGGAALDRLSLSIAPGEFVSVVGPSGCGKSTLLRAASGLLKPQSGELYVNREQLGYTFQFATLLPWRSVRRNVELLMELQGVPREDRRARAQSFINLVGLSGYEDHPPRKLSGGMQMRVALARALSLEPKLFFFDEPFGALDEITRSELQDELLALYAQHQFAALFVTHSIAEAVYLSSRVLVMSRRPGRIVQEFRVPFDYPRAPELRFAPDFARLSGEVHQALHRAQREPQT